MSFSFPPTCYVDMRLFSVVMNRKKAKKKKKGVSRVAPAYSLVAGERSFQYVCSDG